MLKKVKLLDYHGNYAYAPPAVDSIVNTDDITSAKPCEARGIGPFLSIKFKDGRTETMVGTIEELLDETV